MMDYRDVTNIVDSSCMFRAARAVTNYVSSYSVFVGTGKGH
jgi:hypothetical protein